MTTISELRQRAQTAQTAFEEGRGRLFQADGSQFFSDEVHADQLATLRSERNAVLEEVIEETRAILQGTSAEIANLENRDPQELLTPEELERAGARRTFALDAAETLAPADLIARLESVLASEEKPSIFAHWMAGERRRARSLERARENARRGSENPAEASLAESQVSTVTELDGILARMREALDGGRTAQAIEGVRERAREASDVQGMAELARREKSSILGLYEPDYAVPVPGQYPYG